MTKHIKEVLTELKLDEVATPRTKVNRVSTEVSEAFASFETRDDWQRVRMLAAAGRFAQDMLDNVEPYWLTLLGTSGAGKTMLAKIIRGIYRDKLDGTLIRSDEVRITRKSGRFITWHSIATGLRDGDYRYADDVARWWFCALDDIGSEHRSPFIASKMFEFLSNREHRWTVITANLTLEHIGTEFDPRIASRMIRHGSKVVDVDLPDFNA